jgi:hypothetical protein
MSKRDNFIQTEVLSLFIEMDVTLHLQHNLIGHLLPSIQRQYFINLDGF